MFKNIIGVLKIFVRFVLFVFKNIIGGLKYIREIRVIRVQKYYSCSKQSSFSCSDDVVMMFIV